MDRRVTMGARVAAMLGAAVVLVSCSQGEAVRSDAGAVVTAGDLDVFDVRIGDCFMDPEAFTSEETSKILDIDAVPCEEPHHNEVYAIFDLPDGRYPGDEEAIQLSTDGCTERFADFAGTDYESTRLDVTYIYPTRQSWGMGDRHVVCAVYDPAGPLEGSVEGAGEEYALPTAGDCLDTESMPVDCTGEHDAELYLVTEIDGDEYPGDQEVEDEAERVCIGAFADYVGTDYEESALDFYFLAPDQQTWAEGDRVIHCAVYDPAGLLTGSVQGSGD